MSAHDLTQLIRTDRTHGATELALIALEGIAELQLPEPELNALISELKRARPSMSALQVLLSKLESELRQPGVQRACTEVIRQARELQDQAVVRMTGLIAPTDVLMTHSLSSTIKRVFARLPDMDYRGRIIVTESRPGDEGKLLVRFLTGLNIDVVYITEAQIHLLMAETDKVILGADTVLADRSVINKVGSALMAMSASDCGVPVYVCAESFKQVPTTEFTLEEMDPAELGLGVTNVDVRNTYFERIDSMFISEWVY